MIQYSFSTRNAAEQYIQICIEFTATETQHTLQLPSWRPGRYELGNFAKNVRNLYVINEDSKSITLSKIKKDRWNFPCEIGEKITIKYQYYATDLNAGSTYLSLDQLYVNPVNCCMYIDGLRELPCHVKLEIPENFQVATSLKQKKNYWIAENYEELADSPWMASAGLQHNSYTVNETKFHCWFNGEVKVNWEKMIPDFEAFTRLQLDKFKEFPTDEYHFLFQIVPYKAYHGVEHLKSTVILLGPSYAVFEEAYTDLLGVSSHELYHAWNVKAIRPIDLFPYDYTQENYSHLGYLCEGVTTYMGDSFLYRSGVFDFEQYKIEFAAQLQKHFDNFARFHCSVAEASFDTWLDGYVPGAPNRKTSIYTEGCLLAFATDILILKHSKGKFKLDDVMRYLYFNYALKNKGVSEEDYKEVVNHFAQTDLSWLFEDYFYGTRPFESLMYDALDEIGYTLEHSPVTSYAMSKLGFKHLSNGNRSVIKAIYPGSPAEMTNLMLEDEIVAVNGMNCNHDLEKWLNYFDEDEKTIQFMRRGKLMEAKLPHVNRYFYVDYSIAPIDAPTHLQVKMFEWWSK